MPIELRPHQISAVNAVIARHKAGVSRQLISMATGTGKTVVAGFLAKPAKGKTLMLAHREELIDQAAARMIEICPQKRVSVEMAEREADMNADILIASVASLHTRRLERLPWDQITLTIVDEAHHASAASYTKILEKRQKGLLLGLTATPNRADGTPLASIFDEIVFDYPIRQGIEDGVLCDLIGRRVNTETSLQNVRRQHGDFNQSDLALTVNNPERNDLIVKAWMEHAATRRTIVFCVDIQHARDLAYSFVSQGILAQAVWGNDPERRTKILLHKKQAFPVLANCAVLTEGYDDPDVTCIVLARPTQSTLLYTQMIGRGTRVSPWKQNCLILDVADQSTKHDVSTLPDLMGLPRRLNLNGRSVIDAARQIEEVIDANADADLSDLEDLNDLRVFVESFDVINRAQQFPADVIQYSPNAWHHAPGGGYILMLPEKQRVTIVQNLLGQFVISGMVKERVGLGIMRDTHPFHYTAPDLESAFHQADGELNDMGFNPIASRDARWKSKKATEKQVSLIRRLYPNVQIPKDLTAGQASNLINKKAVTWRMS